MYGNIHIHNDKYVVWMYGNIHIHNDKYVVWMNGNAFRHNYKIFNLTIIRSITLWTIFTYLFAHYMLATIRMMKKIFRNSGAKP